jgi:hypothetical protein
MNTGDKVLYDSACGLVRCTVVGFNPMQGTYTLTVTTKCGPYTKGEYVRDVPATSIRKR